MQFGKKVRITTVSPLLLGLIAPLTASAIEIEQRSLSNPAPVTAPAASSAPVAAVPRPIAPVAAQPVAKAPINPAWDMFQQIESLQGTVATLQGQLEEQQQLIERMREDLRVRYTDLDQRIEQLGNKNAPASGTAAAGDTTPAPVTPAATAPAIAVPMPIVETPKAADANAGPTGSTVVPARGAEASTADIEKQKQVYLAAYHRFNSDGAPAAITAMQGFVKQYPDSVFAPNAHYWLGEFQLALEPANYQAAETSFNRVIREYEGSPKVPSAYYKMGTIADLRGQRNEARRWMTDLLARFPSSPEARLAQTFLDQNPATVAPAGSKR